MKSVKIIPSFAASALFVSMFFFSCKKESVSTPVQQQSVDENAEVSKTVDALGTTKLTLKPGRAGQDTYVAFWDGDAAWGNSAGDWAQELSMASWTNQGLPMGVRSFIGFTGINQIPAGAQIISANLFLFAKGSSISSPQGNSSYPGSPYGTDNSCKIERVTGGQWNESTLTWNTQPTVTSTDAAVIPASTSQWSYNAKVDVTNMVKAMAADPAKNFGFRITLVNESAYRSMIFASSENTNPALRPKLVIMFQ